MLHPLDRGGSHRICRQRILGARGPQEPPHAPPPVGMRAGVLLQLARVGHWLWPLRSALVFYLRNGSNYSGCQCCSRLLFVSPYRGGLRREGNPRRYREDAHGVRGPKGRWQDDVCNGARGGGQLPRAQGGGGRTRREARSQNLHLRPAGVRLDPQHVRQGQGPELPDVWGSSQTTPRCKGGDWTLHMCGSQRRRPGMPPLRSRHGGPSDRHCHVGRLP
mmetsp:Transcript_7280/g.18620  ORF Transcript_7280/g.18620 Transcript_7280/m.18620 type:complete len:219 (+) Transcript_7280:533-1189(+)